MIFGLFSKKPKTFPVLRYESIQPPDDPITSADCKQIFRDWMERIGFYEDPDELREEVRDIPEIIRSEMDNLRADLDVYKEEVKDAKARIKDLKGKLKAASGEDKEDIEAELEDELSGLPSTEEDLDEQKQVIADFRRDKRKFIVDYINQLTQSRDG